MLSEPSKTVVELTLDWLTRAFEGGEGKAARLVKGIADNIQTKSLAEPEFMYLKQQYGSSGGKDPCPCGSESQFRKCCRADWQVILKYRDVKRSGTIQERRLEQQQKERLEKLKGETTWYVTLGVHPQLGVLFDFPEGKGVPMAALTELLFKGWMESFLRVSAAHTKEIVMKTLSGMAAQAENKKKENAGR